MRAWRKLLLAMMLLGFSAASAQAQFVFDPIQFPPNVSPEYWPPGPNSTYYPPPPPPQQPNRFIPYGAPIPGTEGPKQIAAAKPSPDPLIISGDGPNAFPCEEPDKSQLGFGPQQGFYVNLGAMALMRNRLGNGGVAFQEPASANPGISTYPTTVTPQLLGYSDIRPNFNFGFRGSVGYQVDDQAVELVGWKIWGTNSFQVEASKDNLYLPFAAFPPPLGMGGGGNNANTWLQVDQVRILDEIDLANLEANYRIGVGTSFQFLLGLRYLNVSERFDILSDQDGLTVTPPDPRFMITYRIQTHSNIIGPQIGFEWEEHVAPWLGVGVYGKGLIGANFYSVQTSVFRADGYTALDNTRSNVTVSGALELGGFVELNPFPPDQQLQMRFRRLRSALCHQCAGRQFRGGLRHPGPAVRQPSAIPAASSSAGRSLSASSVSDADSNTDGQPRERGWGWAPPQHWNLFPKSFAALPFGVEHGDLNVCRAIGTSGFECSVAYSCSSCCVWSR